MNSTLLRRIALGFASVLAVLVAGLFLFVKGEPRGLPEDLADLLVGELVSFELTPPGPALEGTSFVNGDGETRSLDDYRGKYVLLNLWATWCAPCLHEMPTLDRLKAEMASEDFEVLAVSVDRAGVEKSRIFLDRTGAKHLELLVDETMDLNFALKAYKLPTTVLLDREGREIGRIAGDTIWDSPEVKTFIRALIAAEKGDGVN